MLYKQLQRINQLDEQIHEMHQRLAEYYRERAELTTNDATAETPQSTHSIATKTSAKELYDELHAAWRPLGVKLPAYKTISKRLTNAAKIIDTFIADNPQLNGKMHIVATPPQKILDDLMKHPSPLKHRYVFTEDYQNFSSSRVWNYLIVTSADFSLPIAVVSESLGKDEFTYKDYDCRALGIREAIAADIQGVEVVTDNNWTLLLKDAISADYIPCVTKQGNQLVFEIEDARCLLGNNYVQPAVAVKK